MMQHGCDVVGVGENSVDEVYRLPDWPTRGGPLSKLPIASRATLLGGQVTTTLCTCASLGLRTRYIGSFGNDQNGARLRAELHRRGIDTAGAVVRDVPNRYAVILVDERHGERIVLWHRDPALSLSGDELRSDLLRSARLVHVDSVDADASISAAAIARAAGIHVTSDIDAATDRTDELVATVSVPILADHVPAALTGEADPERALRKLRRSSHHLLCVTLGMRGAILLENDRIHHVPGFAVTVTDTTGAGDVFRGGFIYALLRGDAPIDIVRFANAAAAVSCTRAGAMDSVPSLAEVETLAARITKAIRQ